ncbi:MAG: DUF4160 domain-containing protein [Alphaproteobacteria bacterium]
MPIISTFFGITIRMYFADHAPPHFHALYQGLEAFISIETGEVLEGQLPNKARRLVREWCLDHRAELMENWSRGQSLEPMDRIPGADVD